MISRVNWMFNSASETNREEGREGRLSTSEDESMSDSLLNDSLIT